VLLRLAVAAQVDDGVDRGAVALDRHRDRVRALVIEEVRQRQDPHVEGAFVRVQRDHACEVRLLVPQLRGARRLGEEVIPEVAGLERRPLERDAEVAARQLPNEDARVVAVALQRA
jgi:hypothetical protein